MKEDEIGKTVVNAALALHKEVGPGILESVCEVLLADMLRESGLAVTRQEPIAIKFRGKSFDEGFRADLIVGGLVLVELKSISTLARVHKKQVLTYLRGRLKSNVILSLSKDLSLFPDDYDGGNGQRCFDKLNMTKAENRLFRRPLRLSGLKVGLLINFGGELLRGNVERLVNGLEEPIL